MASRTISSRLCVATVALAALSLSGCGIFKGKGGPKTPVLGNRVSILAPAQTIEVDPSLANVAVTLPAPVTNPDWAQPGGNATKAMGSLALADSPTVAWTAQVTGSNQRARLATPPVIQNGKLYVVDTEAVVSAFDTQNGRLLWSTKLDEEGNRPSLFGGGASAEGDRVFATNGVGDVAALDANTGAIIWKKRPGGPLRGAPTLSNGNAYVMSQDNQLYALHQSDGEREWAASGSLESSGVFGVATPAAGQGTVIAGYSSGELSAYRYENGRSLWNDALSRTMIAMSVATLTDVDADPIIDNGNVYALGKGGRMAAYELTTGQRLWELNIAGISTPAVAGEWLFVVTDESKLLCIARTTGKVRWITQLAHYKNEKKQKNSILWSGPVIAGGRLVLTSTDGHIAYVNPQDGTIAANVEASKGISLAPVVANNTLYTIDDDGKITAWR